MSKRAGRKSQSQNDFLQPSAPTSVSATDVGTGRAFDNAAATVSFSLPGGSPAATLYFVTSNPGSITVNGASSPITIGGLTSNTAYTFTVIAQNASGNSSPSSASGSVTVTSVPATPTAPTASSTVADQDSVTWSAPATGGKAISIYYWSCDDGKSGDTASTSVTVTQEGAGASTNAYRVIAANANGNSIVSGYSNSVDTVAPPFFPPFFPPYFAPPFFPPFFPPYFPGVFY